MSGFGYWQAEAFGLGDQYTGSIIRLWMPTSCVVLRPPITVWQLAQTLHSEKMWYKSKEVISRGVETVLCRAGFKHTNITTLSTALFIYPCKFLQSTWVIHIVGWDFLWGFCEVDVSCYLGWHLLSILVFDKNWVISPIQLFDTVYLGSLVIPVVNFVNSAGVALGHAGSWVGLMYVSQLMSFPTTGTYIICRPWFLLSNDYMVDTIVSFH